MTNVDRVNVLSGALHALSLINETKAQAQKVADMLVDSCQKLADSPVYELRSDTEATRNNPQDR